MRHISGIIIPEDIAAHKPQETARDFPPLNFKNGDALKLENGSWVEIIAAKEKVINILSNKEISKIVTFFFFLNLSKYERPKKIYTYSKFFYTETGKIRRSEILNDLHQATEIIQ